MKLHQYACNLCRAQIPCTGDMLIDGAGFKFYNAIEDTASPSYTPEEADFHLCRRCLSTVRWIAYNWLSQVPNIDNP